MATRIMASATSKRVSQLRTGRRQRHPSEAAIGDPELKRLCDWDSLIACLDRLHVSRCAFLPILNGRSSLDSL
jgi:hypothetical protein